MLEGATMTGWTSAATLDTAWLEPALGPVNPTGSGQEHNPHVVSIVYSLWSAHWIKTIVTFALLLCDFAIGHANMTENKWSNIYYAGLFDMR